jgi:hypothetical protein
MAARGAESWIASLRDSRVSHTASPANVEDMGKKKRNGYGDAIIEADRATIGATTCNIRCAPPLTETSRLVNWMHRRSKRCNALQPGARIRLSTSLATRKSG